MYSFYIRIYSFIESRKNMIFLLKIFIFFFCVTLNSLLKCFSIYIEEMDRFLFILMLDDDDKRYICFLGTFIL